MIREPADRRVSGLRRAEILPTRGTRARVGARDVDVDAREGFASSLQTRSGSLIAGNSRKNLGRESLSPSRCARCSVAARDEGCKLDSGDILSGSFDSHSSWIAHNVPSRFDTRSAHSIRQTSRRDRARRSVAAPGEGRDLESADIPSVTLDLHSARFTRNVLSRIEAKSASLIR